MRSWQEAKTWLRSTDLADERGSIGHRTCEAVGVHHDDPVRVPGPEALEDSLEAGAFGVAAREVLVVVPSHAFAPEFARQPG